MNLDELFCGKGNSVESHFSHLPWTDRVQTCKSCFKTTRQFVNNDALRSSATNRPINLKEDFHSYDGVGVEIQTLRKALNLPVDLTLSSNGVTSLSSHWFDQHGGRNVDHLTDSGYSSRVYPYSNTSMQNGTASGYATLGMEDNSNEQRLDASFSSRGMNSLGTSLNSSSMYERSLKSSLEESETKRMMLLEKLREAHLTIQNQAEKLEGGKREICQLQGQLKTIGMEQEGLQQEVDSLTMERKTLEFFKSQSLKNREEFLLRVNDLDNALKALSAKHNALQTEGEKKEAVLEKIQSYATTLQKDNERLREVNKGLTKELSSLKISEDHHASRENDVSKQIQQLNKDYQKVLQEKAVMKRQLSESIKAREKAKSIQEELNQQIVQIRMERDIECGKVIVLEEEIHHHQLSYNNLIKEQERLLKDKAEQDQRLQQEIHERLCLKMVNDLLKEESAYVKEAFQKLEEFTGSVDQKSKDLSPNQEDIINTSTDEMASLKSWNGDLLSKVAQAKSHCEDLQSQLSSVREENRILKTEKDNVTRQFQFVKMQDDAVTNQQRTKSKEVKTENDSLKLSLNTVSKRNKELENMLASQKEEIKTLKQKLAMSHSDIESEKRENINFLQNEVDKIKKTVTRLESEKSELIYEVSTLQKEQELWILQKSELEMSLAELSAENTQLRSELQTAKVMSSESERSTADLMKRVELEKEKAVKKAREDFKKSFDEVCLELETVKSELGKVWDVLEEKAKELEDREQELLQEKEQSQKWAEDLVKLRKDYADLTTKTASRSQMICTLRDELMRRCQEIIELEMALSTKQQTDCNTLEKVPQRRKNLGLKRRRSDGDIIRSHGISPVNANHECNEIKKLANINTQLKRRVQEVMTERDSALVDAQDLLDGMQQLKEAFEEEMEREVERERTNFETEKQLLQISTGIKEDKQPFGIKSKLETEVTLLTEEKLALEVKSKNLECERDELRNQVEELCKMRTAAEEKGVQVDPALSPRKRENKTMRKRSKSVGVIARPNMTIQEIPNKQ